MTNDSVIYLLVARSIAKNGEIARPSFSIEEEANVPVTTWPPLYPAALSLLFMADDRPNLDREVAIAGYNVVLLWSCLLVLSAIFSNFLGMPAHRAVACSLLIFAFPPIHVAYSFAWSETLFIPLVLGALWAACRARIEYHHLGTPLRYVALMTLLLAMSTYARYVGVVFFAGFVAALLVPHRPGDTWKPKLAAVSVLIYGLLMLPLTARNLLLSGHLSGADRIGSTASLGQDAIALLQGLNDALLGLPIVTSVVVVAVSTLGFAFYLRAGLRTAPAWLFVTSLGASLLYLTALLMFRQLQSIDLDSRMLSVIMPLLLAAGVAAVAGSRRSHSVLLPRLFMAVLLFAIVVNGVRSYASIAQSWSAPEYPGWLLGNQYSHFGNPLFNPLRSIARQFPTDNGIVLSDVPRPQVLTYFFPEARILRIRSDALQDRLKDLICTEPGILILTNIDHHPKVAELIGRPIPEGQRSPTQLVIVRLPARVETCTAEIP